jgi:hypothetical protein
MLEKIKVKDLMTKDVYTVDCEEATVFAFETLMKHKQHFITKNKILWHY